MWYDVIPPFTENVNKRWKISLSHSTAELGCSVKDINSQKIFLFLRNWACRNHRHVVLKDRESLYRWRFGYRRYRGKLIHHFILVFFLYIFSLARPAVKISSLLIFLNLILEIFVIQVYPRSADLTDLSLWFYLYSVFTHVASIYAIYWNKRKRLHKKRVQLPEDWFGTPTWPPIHCFRTPIWPPWRHMKTLYI